MEKNNPLQAKQLRAFKCLEERDVYLSSLTPSLATVKSQNNPFQRPGPLKLQVSIKEVIKLQSGFLYTDPSGVNHVKQMFSEPKRC